MITFSFAYMAVGGLKIQFAWLMVSIVADVVIAAIIADGIKKRG